LRLARPHARDRHAPAARVHDTLVRLPGPGDERIGQARPARPALLRAVPGRRRALPAARALDLALPDGLDRRNDGARNALQRRRAPGAPAARAGLPAPECPPALAP